MCGRYALYGPVKLSRRAKAALDALDLDLVSAVNQREPQYNVAPTHHGLVVTADPKGVAAQMFRWGLIPSWAKDAKIGFNTINARVETVGTKPAFRSAFKHRRCLVPASGYFEWKGEPKVKQPYFIHDPAGELLLFAGLWESWHDPKDEAGRAVHSYTIIVGEAGPVSGQIHDRQPVILAPETWEDWLRGDIEIAKAALDARDITELAYYPVTKAVGNVKSQGEDLVQPIAL
ncbi:SOS response-associated peptidase [Dyella humicola]|uniref:SOS response-associated peptidase n=1 Tax=Dyella humicola TaxID=2992126 RepID=UPI002258CBBC|nr:SOS response-associated peptidase [Dyella humicola]